MGYLAMVGIIFAINLLPAFGPPTWSVLVLFRLDSHLNVVALVALGALAAATGRYVLALGTRRLSGHLSRERVANLEAAGSKLTGGRGRTIVGLGLFALSPLPSAQLFVAAGLMHFPLLSATAVFFSGRIVSYSIYVAGATALRNTSIAQTITSSFTSPLGIALQVGMVLVVVVLARLPWIRLLTGGGTSPTRADSD